MDKNSNNYILAKYDVSGIQSYIFATNRLRENAGASYQVTRILEEYLPEAIRAEVATENAGILETDSKDTYNKDAYNMKKDSQVCSEAAEEPDDSKRKIAITEWEKQDSLKLPIDDRIQSEIIYIGGGNAVVLYRTKGQYIRVGQNLGRKVAENCQGIYLAAACMETRLKNFREDIKRLDNYLAENKQKMVRQPAFALFPVVERDNLGYQPITHSVFYEKEGKIEYLTEIQYQKREAYRQIQEWRNETGDSSNYGFKRLYPEIEAGVTYDYPEEAEKLCRKSGEDSFIAVVHIDGNGMGEQVKEVMSGHKEYEKGVPKLREKSKEISKLFGKTYEEMLRILWGHEEILMKSDEQEGEKIFPIRPILLDGDDFTFLCTADLAIPLAAGFMKQLSVIQKDGGKRISACAGIAFVHSHFPFYEAYKIAEESCSNAKKKWYAEKARQKKNPTECYLDFQVIKESEIGAFRRDSKFQLRPYAVSAQGDAEPSCTITLLYETLREMEKNWPSNRLHKIYRAMLSGEEKAEILKREYQSRGYYIENLTGTKKWEQSPLFDALEIRGICRTDMLKEFLNIQDEVSQ